MRVETRVSTGVTHPEGTDDATLRRGHLYAPRGVVLGQPSPHDRGNDRVVLWHRPTGPVERS
jgi:hypothetical protein